MWLRGSTAASVLLLLTHLVVFAQTPPGHFEWDTNRSTVRFIGEMSPELQSLDSDKLQQLFSVTVEPAHVLSAIGLPPIAGNYSAGSNYLQFKPRFPFEAGLSYRATYTPSRLSSVLRVPQAARLRTTVVSEIYPTAEVLPQNLLKFYLHFSAPMSGGQIYQHIHLTNDKGEPVELPFLEIDEELWNPQMTRLTLFLDPGRIKREVRPLEEIGPALVPDKEYILRISEDWPDAQGVPLKKGFDKRFHVSEPDREAPDPERWRISQPKQGTREPLTIAFSDPMDHALALRLISLSSVRGHSTLGDRERIWRFEPDQPWEAGRYELLVQSTIEDLAGNNIGKPFEVDLHESKPREPAKTITLGFQVR